MSIDIQKQINFRAQNNNIINAPQQFSNEPKKQPVDEEKSNAAKWMIGLTATAAIVIGGIYAAKKGHLGKTAEKYANRLLGTTDSVKPKPETGSTSGSTSASSTSTATSATKSTASTASGVAAVIPPLIVARKAISRLIKSPKNLTETIQSLQDAGVAFERNDNLLSVKTGKKIEDITFLMFDEAGTSCAIARPNKQNVVEVFEINNGSLETIARRFDGLKPPKIIGSKQKEYFKPLTHKVQLDDKRKVIEETWEVAENELDQLTLTSVKGLKDSFNANSMANWKDFLSKQGSKLPARLKKAKIYNLKEVVNGKYDTAQYLTARVAKYYDAPLSSVPKEIPAEEFARFIHKTTDNHFSDVVESFNVERNIAHRVSDTKIPVLQPRRIICSYDGSGEYKEVNKVKEEFLSLFERDKSGRKAEVYTKLLKDDLGTAEKFNTNTIITAGRSYTQKFKTYGLDKNIDLMEISVKPLCECSYDEVFDIVRHIAPKRAGELGVVQDPFKNKDQEQKAISKLVEIVTGRKNIDTNTKLFDLLQDIS